VLVSVNSDAHSTDDFRHLDTGIGQARRGWLAKRDVLNTRTLAQLQPRLAHTMGKGRRHGAPADAGSAGAVPVARG
jgi:DNA polymerase (family 10)